LEGADASSCQLSNVVLLQRGLLEADPIPAIGPGYQQATLGHLQLILSLYQARMSPIC
jgi:hypothetical protein